MVLYHGSNLAVAEPKLVVQNRFLDFGFGFYTTLKVKKLYNQLVLTSEKALAHLRYIRSLQGEELG